MREWCDMNVMYKTRFKGEVTVGAVRVVEEGAADYGVWGHYGPPKLWISLFSFVFLFVCVRARAEFDTSAWRLSEAKTQRRPRARERE